MPFVPLFCISHHSPHGVAAPDDLARRARNLGYTTLGICDDSTIAGFHAFDEACREQGIRPVFGCRLPLTGLTLTGRSFPIDFLIETEQGYRNLVRLLNRCNQNGRGERRVLEPRDLAGRTQGMLCVVPADGELSALLDLQDREASQKFLKQLVDLFPGVLAFAVPPTIGETADRANLIHRLARFVKARPLAALRVQYPEPGDAAAAVYLDNPRQAPSRSYTPPADPKLLPALWSEEEMLARWTGAAAELSHEAGETARRCAWRPGLIRRAFPSLDLERGVDPNSHLFSLVIQGATQRYGEITETLKQRINREFEEIKSQGLGAYLLLNHQIVGMLDSRGISRGVGRGRLVASVLAYCLGISRIDPLQYNLVPKQLIADGETFPPITIEIPRDSVTTLVEMLRESHGDDHLIEIGRLAETRRDQMIQELAVWSGMTEEEQRLAHREKSRLRSAGAAQRLSELAQEPRARRWRDPSLLGDVAARLAPRPRAWMAAGDRFALCNEALEAIVPCVLSPQGRPVSGMEEPAIDRLGLARLVFVPHGLLDTLDEAMRNARTHDPHLNFSEIPLDDRITFDLLARGETSGIPPLESVTLRCMLQKLRPSNLLQLLRVKSESVVASPADRPRDLGEGLPDVILSYQCAYLRANHPLPFYGAAIGSVIDQGGNPTALIRQATRAGIHLEPPEINLSLWETTVHGGSIRLGLAAVKGLGRAAWRHIEQVRSGGRFTSLENFCERVENRLLNLRLLRNLIASGAMDDLGANRATMDATAVRLQRRSRGRIATAERPIDQASLFDFEELVGDDEPESEDSPPVEDWNAFEKPRREAEAMGFCLSADPIRRLKIALDHLNPLHIEDLTPRHLAREIRLVGLMGDIEREGPLHRAPGDVIADLEGLAVYLKAHLAELSAQCFVPGTEVLVIGRLHRDDGFLALDAQGIWRLADLEDQAAKVARLKLRLAGENKATLKLLLDVVRQFAGSTPLALDQYPGRAGWLWRRLSRSRVFFCSPLYQGLCKILPPEAIELFGHEGEPLLVKATTPAAPPESEEDGSGSDEA